MYYVERVYYIQCQSYKELIGESLQPTEAGIFTTPMFYKYKNNFFITKYFKNFFSI